MKKPTEKWVAGRSQFVCPHLVPLLIETMRALIQEVADGLKQKSFDELLDLAEHASTKLKFEGRAVTVSIWRDRVGDEEIQLVVQGYRHFVLGIGKMDAVGFHLTRHGELRDLRREELYEFI